jgi:signal transduction histidine kinase
MNAATEACEIEQVIQLDESPERTVTSPRRRPGTSVTERKRQQRKRDRTLMFERDDWTLFFDPATLPQKAGCQPEYLRQIVLREVVDNALDAGAHVTLRQHDGICLIADDGPGLDPADVPRLFSVNRPLVA